MEKETIIDNDLNKDTPVEVVEPFMWQVPECCREGWDSCKHVAQKQEKTKRNVGL